MSEELARVKLKRLRVSTGIGLRRMARLLGMPTSSYDHYETRLKERYLPIDFAVQVADVLEREKQVDRSVVLALAGSEALTGAQTLDERFLELAPHRQQLVLGLVAELLAAEAYYRGAQSPDDGSEQTDS